MKNVKKQTVILAVIFGLSSSPTAKADGSGPLLPPNNGPFPAPELVKIPSEQIFVPPGFDDNDNVQIVIQSLLINTCYKAAFPTVTLDRAQHLITVSTQAYVYSSSWCLQMLIPVTQAVDIGPLSAGNYRIVEYGTAGRLIHDFSLSVGVSTTAAPDDYLYAPVNHATVELGSAGSQKTLILSGTFTSDCLEMQEVKVFHRSPNIIEVLPIAAYKTGATCQPNPKPFELRVTLPSVEPGNTLIYVRSLNGQAISDVEPF